MIFNRLFKLRDTAPYTAEPWSQAVCSTWRCPPSPLLFSAQGGGGSGRANASPAPPNTTPPPLTGIAVATLMPARATAAVGHWPFLQFENDCLANMGGSALCPIELHPLCIPVNLRDGSKSCNTATRSRCEASFQVKQISSPLPTPNPPTHTHTHTHTDRQKHTRTRARARRENHPS